MREKLMKNTALLLVAIVSLQGMAQCPTDALDLADGGTFSGPCTHDFGASLTITGTVIWNGDIMDLGEMYNGLIIANGASLIIQSGIFNLNAIAPLDDSQLTVVAGGVLQVSSGAILNVETDIMIGGDAFIAGGLNVTSAGSITVTDSLSISGTISIAAAGSDDPTGDIIADGGAVIVQNNGSLTAADDAKAINDGVIEIQPGGELNVGDVLVNSEFGNPPVGGGSQGSFIVNGTAAVQNEVYLYDTDPDSQISGTGSLEILNPAGDFTNLERDFSSADGTNCGGGTTCIGVNPPLPVSLVFFRSEIDGIKTKLVWATAQEVDNEGFFVETSSDGFDFRSIGFVPGKGNTNELTYYSFDVQDVGTNSFFRLRQIDFDGSYEIYASIIVEGSSPSGRVIIYPGSVLSNGIRLNGPAGFYSIGVVSGSGKLVAARRLMTLKEAEIMLSNLQQAGLLATNQYYMLHYMNGVNSGTVRFMGRN